MSVPDPESALAAITEALSDLRDLVVEWIESVVRMLTDVLVINGTTRSAGIPISTYTDNRNLFVRGGSIEPYG